MTSGEQIRLLRERIPIGIKEGLTLLKKHDGDFNRTILEFTGNDLQKIITATGCTESTAEQFYFANRRDVPRAITGIIEEAYDKSYVPSAHITLQDINLLYSWLRWQNDESLESALYFEIDDVLQILKHIPELTFLHEHIKNARLRKNEILGNVSYDADPDKYIALSWSLRSDPVYRQCEEAIDQYAHRIDKVLIRHWRNLAPRID